MNEKQIKELGDKIWAIEQKAQEKSKKDNDISKELEKMEEVLSNLPMQDLFHVILYLECTYY